MIVLGTTIAATGIALWWRSARAELPKIALCGALLGWWFGAASTMWVDASYVMAWGSDFAGDQWHRSELLAWGRAHGARPPLYSNWPVVAYFYLRRPARDIPRLNESSQLREFADSVRVHDGLVLAFKESGMEYVTVDSLAKTVGLAHDRADLRTAPCSVRRHADYTSTPADSRSPISSALSAPPNR